MLVAPSEVTPEEEAALRAKVREMERAYFARRGMRPVRGLPESADSALRAADGRLSRSARLVRMVKTLPAVQRGARMDDDYIDSEVAAMAAREELRGKQQNQTNRNKPSVRSGGVMTVESEADVLSGSLSRGSSCGAIDDGKGGVES